MTVKYIPIPPELLRRSRHPGKFQDCRPTVTIRQFKQAVEVFSGGRTSVLGKRDSEKAHRQKHD